MAYYRFKFFDDEKNVKSGIVEADNDANAMEILNEKGIVFISLEKENSLRYFNIFSYFKRITSKDVVIFSRQFSVMIAANLVIVQALKIAVEQTENPKLRKVISQIAYDVDNGSKLSDALSKYPKIFSSFYVSVVRSGETSGKLDSVLNYLADEMEKDFDIMAKIRGAMIYPAIILVGMVIVGFIMIVFVIPKLTETMQESNAELPFTTKVLINISDFFTSYFMTHFWWLILIIIALISYGLRSYLKTSLGKGQFDHLLLKIPVFGKLIQKVYIIRFSRTMNTLIIGGVTIVDSLRVARDVIANSIYRDLIDETILEVEGGNNISNVFERNVFMPKMVSQLISVGEKTGRLDLVLEKVTNFYSKEVDNTTNNLMVLLEPIIMIILGLGVGFLISAIILPMYNMANAF